MADAQEFLKDFPLLNQKINGRKVAYLDNGATTQKPEQMIQSICGYYGGCNANPHRGAYALSIKATDIYEGARERTAKFIKAKRPQEIIFTKNATEALNLVAYSYGLHNVNAGDEIVISISEHHSNCVPWQMVAKAKGATLKYIYLEEDGNLSQEDIETKITERTKIVAVTQVSNVLGLKNDVKAIVDVSDLDCDFFAFSGHKMLSPMGIGVLYGKYELLDAMEPFLRGGDMIEYVEEQDSTWAEVPAKFEAGTQNVGGAAGLVAAIDYLEKISFERIEAIEADLLNYALPQLRDLPFIELYGCDTTRDNKTGIIAFNVKDVHPHDVASILDNDGVAVRAGHHCAQPLHRYLGQNATCRASFYLYNTREDIDRWIESLKKVRGVLGYGA